MKSENFCFLIKKSRKSFGSSKNSRTFASAFAQNLGLGAKRSEFFERLT